LDRFGVDELADILARRAEAGLRGGVGPDGAVRRQHLERIADGVAGVTRDGIQTLRAAAGLTVEREHGVIREPDIDDAYARAEQAIRAANLGSLPFAHRFLYELIRRADSVAPATLWDRYDAVAEAAWEGRLETPPTRRTRRNYLERLWEYGLVELDGRVHQAATPGLAADVGVPLE
jgi:Cdc6-like AAA superfamily ATPase